MAFPFKNFRRKVKDKVFGKTTDTSSGVQQAEMADARMGIMYFLGNTQAVGVPNMDLGIFSSFVANPTALKDMKKLSLGIVNSFSAGRAVAGAVSGAVDSMKSYLKPVTDMIKGFFDALLKKIIQVFGGDLDGVEAISEYFVWASAELTQVLSNAIPAWGYVQSAADMYEGVKKGVTGAWRIVEQIWSGYGVKLLGGHPSIIANALARHSLAMLAYGFKDMAVAGTKIGLQAAGDAMAGVGALFSAISGILQRIANLVGRYIQRLRVASILERAREEWKLKGSDQGLIADHQRFSEWFQSAVITTPIISALVLNSGFAAHPYRFLKLIGSSGQVASQASFDKGVAHIEKLKSIGSRYIKEYSDAYRMTFTSEDQLVDARLKEMLNGKGVIVMEPEIQWVKNPLYQGA